MTIVQLEYLLAVANYGSFSIASEHCFVTQPSLSMQIKNLEDELGVILLDRSKKPVVPTEAGAIVIRNARETLKAYNYVKESINELKGDITGILNLGVIPTISPYLIHKLIPEFSRRYPKAELKVWEMLSADIVEAMNRDKLDAAIVAGGLSIRGITEHELFDDRFYAYVSPLSALHGRSNVRIEDISPKELLLLADGHCLRDQVLELCQGVRRNTSNYSFECGSLETLMRVVDNSSAMTVIPEIALPYIPDHKRHQIKSLAKGAVSRKISIIVRRTYAKNSLVKALKESILNIIK